MLLTMVNLTLVQLKEKFQSWEAKFEIGGGVAQSHSESPKHHVANFAGASPSKKWKYGKQQKKPFQMICYECEQPGLLARVCPNSNHSHRSDSSPGRKRNAGSANGSRGGRGENNKFKAQRQENGSQNHFGKKIDGYRVGHGK